MLRAAFNLTDEPFTKDIKTVNLYMHPLFKEMIDRMGMLFINRGIGLFTGEVGCGKSTAIRAVLETLSPQTHRVVYLYRGMDNVGAFYTQIAAGLGIIPKFRKSDVANQVLAAIEELYTQQKIQTVIVIDEAHLLKPDLLDEIRLLHNNQYDSVDYLATALVGQPPLKKTISFTKFLPLRQRISVAYHIAPLTKDQAYAYFDHQLACAKTTQKIFMDNAVETIICASKCVPRMINTIAHKAMSHAAFDKKMSVVDQECVLDVLEELGLK
jgi:type II secretory pathway predicted ATPase ExeA